MSTSKSDQYRTFVLGCFFLAVILCLGERVSASCHYKLFSINGTIWKDKSGNPINAHGAGILKYGNQYFLYGEIKKGKTTLFPGQNWLDYRVPAGGVSCYSSRDLLHWTYEGVALAPDNKDSANILHISKVIERPKVIYNAKTRKFVMWLHVDNAIYSLANVAVAESSNPKGPFRLIANFRPNGNESRDMTVFKDNDGSAYLVYSSENNATMHICKLSEDYLSTTEKEIKIFIGMHREAPAMFRSGNTYYLVTSAVTGWAPNRAAYAVAVKPLGIWKIKGNPCRGKGAENTFGAQSTFVLPLSNHRFVFMADRWKMMDLENSTYVWLPLIAKKGRIEIKW